MALHLDVIVSLIKKALRLVAESDSYQIEKSC